MIEAGKLGLVVCRGPSSRMICPQEYSDTTRGRPRHPEIAVEVAFDEGIFPRVCQGGSFLEEAEGLRDVLKNGPHSGNTMKKDSARK